MFLKTWNDGTPQICNISVITMSPRCILGDSPPRSQQPRAPHHKRQTIKNRFFSVQMWNGSIKENLLLF